jgi:hypothetical protein
MILNSDEYKDAIIELHRRSKHAINTYAPTNQLNHDQLSFHKSTHRYRLLFGGNQSGKSHAAAYEIACWARGKHPHRKIPKPPIDIWVISAEYVTLRTGIYRHLRNIIPDWEIEKFGPNVIGHLLPAYIIMKNGSMITFQSAKGDARQKFQAAAVHLISIDEEVQGSIWEELQARTLATGGNFIISATLLESYDWILNLERQASQKDSDVFLSRLNTELNPYLDTATVQHLKETWSKDTQEVRLYGKSLRSTGLVYNTWDSTKHKIKKFPIPKEWPRWCAIDPGIRTCAVLWITCDQDNHSYAYRELYAHNEPLHQIALSIKAAEGWKLNKELSFKYNHFVWEETSNAEHVIIRVIDDKLKSRLITGDPGVLTQLYDKYGISSTPADKALRPGIEDIRLWLEPLEDGEPGFRCFNHLENFLMERRSYRIRTKKSKQEQNEAIDEPIRKQNHLMDCWRDIAREYPRWSDHIPLELSREPLYKQLQSEKVTTHEWLGENW